MMNDVELFGMSAAGLKISVGIRTSVLTDDHQLLQLKDEWDKLLDQSNQGSFFLRWSWNELWWRIFRPSRSHLFIVTCRDERGVLVGLAPLYWRQHRTAGLSHLRELQFLGTGIFAQTSEYLDLIARRGFEQIVAESVADFLLSSPDWERLCLTEVPADSEMLSGLERRLGVGAEIRTCNRSYFINTDTDWDEFRSGLTSHARTNIFRRARRLFEEFDCEFRVVDRPEEFDPAMDALIELHQARWRSKGEPGTFALNGSGRLIREAARNALATRRLRLWTLSLDKKIVAAMLGLVDKGVLHAFQSGYDPAYNGLGSVMIGLCIRACVNDEAVQYFDFMGGPDQYKQRWTRDHRDSATLVYSRKNSRSMLYEMIDKTIGVVKWISTKVVPRRLKLGLHNVVIRRRYYSNR
jgi:CelD/BcsL family acetyltransferase involved in cellulose biosynthesis